MGREWLAALALVVIAAAAAFDLWLDLMAGAGVGHVAKEAVVLAGSLLLLTWMGRELARRAALLTGLRGELAEAAARGASASAAEQALRRQLGELIARQFETWGLTPSEREIGWLLLKGLSLREIAVLRDTVEKTVRQQASAVYRKAGVSGRHAFAAWFIEDYL